MHLSHVFKYISKFRHAGHQVGRKVGDMLEVLTYSALCHDPELKKRLQIEPKIFGFCDAGHKVEFGILKEPRVGSELVNSEKIEDPALLIGFIECKKVGVEQTVNQSFKTIHAKNRYEFKDKSHIKFFSGRKSSHPAEVVVNFYAISPDSFRAEVNVNGHVVLDEVCATGHRIIFARTEQGGFKVIGNDGSLRDVADELLSCRILEFKTVAAGVATLMLNECLPGPQTPEKAKQASFVALDIRKRRFGQFDMREDEKELVSILVLTEYSHWEQKSQNMVNACLDQVLVVPDEIIIEAFTEFEKKFGADFYQHISKEQYVKNADVKAIADKIVATYEGKIFLRTTDGKACAIEYSEGVLAVT